MPITRKVRDEEAQESDGENGERTFTSLMHKARWFVISQTIGDDRIGWHTFRHTFGTILNANGENPKVIQELMRHANLKVAMDTYVQAVSDEKRNAQSKVVEMMLLPGIRRAVR